jgi:sulfide dehydrogenase [flavocytochrome c] flavoprotein subunit
MIKTLSRREFLQFTGAAAALSAAGCATAPAKPKARVVVIGGGFGGATTAKYLRLWDPGVEVILVERENAFTSCPMSNLVIGGLAKIEQVRHGYDGLRKYGVQLVFDEARAVDADKRVVRLARGGELTYDRLVVAPGIDFNFDEIAGYREAMQAQRVLHAWKAGEQTLALRRQLEAMPDGGVVAIAIPAAPYRCPPGPYERACLVADYLKKAKPRSKVLILDGNADVISKGPLFKRAWEDLYKGMIEYRGGQKVLAVDPKTGQLKLEVDDVKADVVNVIPPQRAGDIAVAAKLTNVGNRWCGVNWRTAESTAVKGVHVIGDSTASAPLMPKSGSMANQHGKLVASAIIALINGQTPNQTPKIANTCYSFVAEKEAIRVSSVHTWNEKENTLTTVAGSGGVSAARNAMEVDYAWAWANAIWADTLS